eukprot:scaffold1240_cov101-Isochrysis_galbana.AAC.7
MRIASRPTTKRGTRMGTRSEIPSSATGGDGAVPMAGGGGAVSVAGGGDTSTGGEMSPADTSDTSPTSVTGILRAVSMPTAPEAASSSK